jgi:signal transduction histidine kinase
MGTRRPVPRLQPMEIPRPAKWRALVTDPRVVDGALVLGCLLFTAVVVKASWSVLPRPVIAVAGVAGSAAQWSRRRRPHLAAVAGAAGYALSGNPGPLLVGLFSGATYARRHVWLLAVVGWAGFAGWSWNERGRLVASDAESAALAAVLVVCVGVYAATRRALTASWQERAERADAERLLRDEQARSAERTRIAREMHDVLAHKVSLIALHAGALELNADGDPGRVRQGAGLIRVTAREALQELRTALGVLQGQPTSRTPHDGSPEPAEPFSDLTSLVQASTQAGQHVELHDHAGPLPPNTARVVYRIAQEGLTNAHKHAPDAPTTVTVHRDEEGNVTVTIHNGPGRTAPMGLPGSGSGLVGLAERIRLVGGTLHSGPSGGDGWQMQAVVPWLDQRVEERPADVEHLVRRPDAAL